MEKDRTFNYVGLDNTKSSISLEPGTLAFTYCQVPIVYHISDQEKINLTYNDGSSSTLESTRIDLVNSNKIFQRSGEVSRIDVYIKKEILR